MPARLDAVTSHYPNGIENQREAVRMCDGYYESEECRVAELLNCLKLNLGHLRISDASGTDVGTPTFVPENIHRPFAATTITPPLTITKEC